MPDYWPLSNNSGQNSDPNCCSNVHVSRPFAFLSKIVRIRQVLHLVLAVNALLAVDKFCRGSRPQQRFRAISNDSGQKPTQIQGTYQRAQQAPLQLRQRPGIHNAAANGIGPVRRGAKGAMLLPRPPPNHRPTVRHFSPDTSSTWAKCAPPA